MTDDERLELAADAFKLMTLSEKRAVIVKLPTLHYPNAVDRFFEAVYSVVLRTPEMQGFHDGEDTAR